MLVNVKKMIGCKVHAKDGDLGEITSLYFDREIWKTRYLSVEIGSWYSSKQVLIPAASIVRHDIEGEKKVYTNLSREQVRNSPDVDLSLPISRGSEADIARHYSLPMYWDTEKEHFLFPPEDQRTVSMGGKSIAIMDITSGAGLITDRIPGAKDLNSAADVLDYDVKAVDGEVGDVDDMLVDDSNWQVRYLVTDAGKIEENRKILLSPEHINSISDADKEVRTDLTKDAIKNSPAYDQTRPVDTGYESRLREHYAAVAMPSTANWRFDFMRHNMPKGKKLRIETKSPAIVRWTADNWKSYSDMDTKDAGNGTHFAELGTEHVDPGNSIHFTFYWKQANHWENKNYSVRVIKPLAERIPALTGSR